MRKHVLCAVLLVACSKQSAPSASVDAAAPAASVSAAAVPRDAGRDAGETAYQRISKLQTMGEAIDFVRPDVDTTGLPRDGGGPSGATLFSLWANDRMRWSDVSVTKDETTYALVMKDTDEAIGKRMCPAVRVDVIRAISRKDEPRKAFAVFMRSNDGSFFGFSVGSTEGIVDHAGARFCGVVLGRKHKAEGDGTDVVLVGMFDLPENH